MKKTLIALATMSALTGVAQAQSNVTIYGVVDAAVRTANHQNADGGRLRSVDNGLLQGSRLGFKGQEDLGNGLKAVFQLESGFNINNGTEGQNGGAFSRIATVGLSDATYGTLTIGRQNSLAYDTILATDVYHSDASNTVLGGYQAQLTGMRWDNSVKYTNTFNNFNVGLQYSAGNEAGNTNRNSGYGVNAGYTASNWGVQGVYQVARDTNDGTLGSLVGQNQDFWSVGGNVVVAPKTNVFAQYAHNKFDVTNQTNKIYTIGVSQKLAGNWSVKGAATYDKQENVAEGNRKTVSAVLDYSFSKRTDLYAAVDYNKLSGNYSNVGYNLNSATNPNTNSTGVSVGLRHAF